MPSKNRNLSTLAPANVSTFQVSSNATVNGTLTTSDVTINGNLVVSGTTVTVNTATLDVKDLNITVAKGANSTTANTAGITVDGANAQLFYLSADDSLNVNKVFKTTNTVTIGTGSYFVANGSVGIGTTSPLEKLDVRTGAITAGGTINGRYFLRNSSNTFIMDFGIGTGTGGSLDVGLFNVSSNGVLVFGTNSTERVRIDNIGMGVGASTIGAKITIGGLGDQYINREFANGSLIITGGPGIVSGQSSGGFVARGSADPFNTSGVEIYASGFERFRVNNSGDVAIGNGGVANNTLRYLDLYNVSQQNSSGAIFRFITSNAANTGTVTVDMVKYKTGAFVINNNETSSSAYISMGVGGPERFRIDNTGKMTIPYQPAFRAYSSGIGNYTTTAGGVIPIQGGVWFDNQSNFNTSTSRFTAPVAGVYMFCFIGYNNGSTGERVSIRVNGSVAMGQGSRNGNSGNDWEQTVVVKLAVNDYVDVRAAYGGGTIFLSAAHTELAGYLVG